MHVSLDGIKSIYVSCSMCLLILRIIIFSTSAAVALQWVKPLDNFVWESTISSKLSIVFWAFYGGSRVILAHQALDVFTTDFALNWKDKRIPSYQQLINHLTERIQRNKSCLNSIEYQRILFFFSDVRTLMYANYWRGTVSKNDLYNLDFWLHILSTDTVSVRWKWAFGPWSWRPWGSCGCPRRVILGFLPSRLPGWLWYVRVLRCFLTATSGKYTKRWYISRLVKIWKWENYSRSVTTIAVEYKLNLKFFYFIVDI